MCPKGVSAVHIPPHLTDHVLAESTIQHLHTDIQTLLWTEITDNEDIGKERMGGLDHESLLLDN